ncbi:nascent polypeptide-associated complex subunit alpha, muscle-specific form [Amphiprion ocellaris]|uniref:PH domain-containing protein n=1 Tax=Amphiprion ocellaris TaxID=80972 RepID=A0AAQ5XVP5_AMPOC|nr:nascent polypeptide-associated complex subunit alpha, muscle-specific form [Amphiprion ocellaris]
MEDGVKEDSAQKKEPKFLGKAGWLKKAPGRLLASYKDRYIHVEKTEVVVYETEDLQNSLERLDLENYDTCHELKSPFKKKHRLILLRSPKSGNKVHDVKFQAQTAEEKEAWIKALIDGINRAKNKVFDEVKVDESNNLEHVTRTRPKGNRNRRPPTRIHMKEVAVVSSEGILRLDLDLEGAIMPNGNHNANVDGTESLKEAVSAPESNTSKAAEKPFVPSAEEEVQGKVSPQKKVIKPPMPPSKEAKFSSAPEDEPDKDDDPETKVLKPPMPPSKEAKPCASPVEEVTEQEKPDKVPEMSSDARKKTGPPPMPPNKPSSNSSMSSLAEALQSRPNSHLPTPPSKENKPSPPAVEPVQQVLATSDENTEKKENSKKEINEETYEVEESIPNEALTHVRGDKPESPTTEGTVSEEESGETISSGINRAFDDDPEVPTEPLRTSHSPLLIPPEKLDELVQPGTSHIENCSIISLPTEGRDAIASDTSINSHQVEDELPKYEGPSVVVSLNDPPNDSLSLSPLLCHLSMEKKKKAEEKSVDSGQHSDDNSEGSGSEDTLAVSTAALRGSHAGLDVLDASEDDSHMSVISRPALVSTKPQVRPKVFPCGLEPPTSLKPSVKTRSASFGDLLSDSAVCIQVKQSSSAGAGIAGALNDDVLKLETEVALEMEKTSKLLSRVSQAQERGDGEGIPENLLAKAMEKLKTADHVLREVKKLKLANSSSNRKSW